MLYPNDLIFERFIDVTREDPRVLDLYGNNQLARQLLLARRLCEAGVGFVTLNFGGWDMHGQIAQNMNRLGPIVDHAVSAFAFRVSRVCPLASGCIA